MIDDTDIHFRQEWLCTPSTAATPDPLRELADLFIEITEQYDRIVCTGPVVDGQIRPQGPGELGLVSRHALGTKSWLGDKAEELGFTRAELQRAIREQEKEFQRKNRGRHD